MQNPKYLKCNSILSTCKLSSVPYEQHVLYQGPRIRVGHRHANGPDVLMQGKVHPVLQSQEGKVVIHGKTVVLRVAVDPGTIQIFEQD